MQRALKILTSALPLLIIGGLLYAGLFVKPEPKGGAVQTPVFERGDRFYGATVRGGTAWVVGSSGKILRSQDEARSWQPQASPVTVSLQDVSAWDDQRAVAVGNEGAVVITSDGGQSWRAVEAPRSKIANKLLRVKALPAGHAWAVGEGGSVLHSTDFGNSWRQVLAAEDIAWNDIFFIEERAWLVGEFGRIKVSNDIGASWRDVKGPVKTSLMSVAFKDARNGVAVGLNGVILDSHDGGESWTEEKSQSPEQSSEMTAAGDRLDPGRILQTFEQGKFEHLFSLIWDGNRWVAVGAKGVVLIGTADGREWKATRLSPNDRNWYTTIVKHDSRYTLAGSRVTEKEVSAL